MVRAVTARAGASAARSGVAGTSVRSARWAWRARRARSPTHRAAAITTSCTTDSTAAARRSR